MTSKSSERIDGSALPGVHVNRGNDLVDARLLRSHDVDATPGPRAPHGTMSFVLLDGTVHALPLGGRSIEYMNGLVDAARAIAPASVEFIDWR